jgi:hypothetical protein
LARRGNCALFCVLRDFLVDEVFKLFRQFLHELGTRGDAVAVKGKEKAIQQGLEMPKEDPFDSNCITPGTEFMQKLTGDAVAVKGVFLWHLQALLDGLLLRVLCIKGRSEYQMFIAIFNYIEHLFGKIKPKKLFYMAVDGVAPRPGVMQLLSKGSSFGISRPCWMAFSFAFSASRAVR